MNFEVDSGTGPVPAGTVPVVHHYIEKSKITHLYRIYIIDCCLKAYLNM